MLPITAPKVAVAHGNVKHCLTTTTSGCRRPESRRAGVSASLGGGHALGRDRRRRVRTMTIVETATPAADPDGSIAGNPYAPDPEIEAIRQSVRALCAGYPGEYWRAKDPGARLSDRVRPRAHRGRLPRRAGAGGLWRQRPRPARRLRDPRGDPQERRQRRGLPCPDVHHGHDPAPRFRGAEDTLAAGHRLGRPAAPGLRRHRAGQRHRHAFPAHRRREEGQRPLCRERPEGLDLARRAFGPDAAACPHDAEARRSKKRTDGLSVFLVDMRHARRQRHGRSGRSAP